jgi:urease accessory protein
MLGPLMRALQLGDSALPVGAFAFSNGLESAVQHKVVTDVESLRQFVRTAARQAGAGDGIGLLAAHRAAAAGDVDDVIRADRAVLCRKLNEETRQMTVRMGRKLGELAERVAPGPMLAAWLAAVRAGAAPGTHPVALAVAAAGAGLDERAAFAVHQYGVAAMMLSAALRLMRVSHLDTQAILFEVNEGADALYARAAPAALDDMAGFAPLADVLAASHAQAHVRLFMN